MILFVCTGNTCRSPMAEGIWNAKAKARGLVLPAASCGIGAFPGEEATPQAVKAAEEYGADLTAHRSRRLTIYDLEQAKAVYCMTRQQAAALRRLVPELAEKISCLDQQDIMDPFGGGLELYRETAKQIARAVERRMEEWAL